MAKAIDMTGQRVGRLIDVDEAKRRIVEFTKGCHPEVLTVDSIVMLLDKAPTVDAVPVVHGRWVKDGEVVVCSECGAEHAWEEYRATYCEDCGAKMDD